jgi:hypothetical protein
MILCLHVCSVITWACLIGLPRNFHGPIGCTVGVLTDFLNWIHLAHEENQLFAVVNTVTNVRV